MTTSLEQRLSELDIANGSVATVGTFDGVHLGHRKLLETVRDLAAEREAFSLAIAFKAQPRALIQPDRPVTYLATLDRRIDLIRSTGVDRIAPVDFDEPLRQKTAREFLETLRHNAGLKAIVIGEGAILGHDRAESTALKEIAASIGVEVIEVAPVTLSGQRVSSSAIREALTSGDVGAARDMLGRPYAVDGTVEHGDQRGRELGFPTANTAPEPGLAIPGDGIYATIVEVGGERKMAATSIGVRPTFGGGARLVEAYLLDFDRDIYSQRIGIEFIARLRGEMKFDSADALIARMRNDVEQTRSVLSGVI